MPTAFASAVLCPRGLLVLLIALSLQLQGHAVVIDRMANAAHVHLLLSVDHAAAHGVEHDGEHGHAHGHGHDDRAGESGRGQMAAHHDHTQDEEGVIYLESSSEPPALDASPVKRLAVDVETVPHVQSLDAGSRSIAGERPAGPVRFGSRSHPPLVHPPR